MKVSGNIYRISFTLLFIICVTVVSCKKDDDGPTPQPVPPVGSTLKTNVTGKITNTDGDALSGVTVTLSGKSVATDQYGIFLFRNIDVPKDRIVLKASKYWHFDCLKGIRTHASGVHYADMVLQELPAAVNVNAASGGTVNISGGSQIVFQPNSFVYQNGNPYTGTVKVYARHFNPAAPGFASIVPGGDLLGKNLAGEDVALFPMGMIEGLLSDQTGQNELKLAPGTTALLRMPIDPSQNAMAQSTVPLWHLNETTGIWKEEGEAVKNGNFFEGNVSHFSVWNCDYQGERADLKGLVIDCNGNPLTNAKVTINGFLNVTTNNSGIYTAWVPVGFLINCQLLTVFNPVLSLNSQVVSFVASSGLNNVQTISVTCPAYITGNVIACNGNSFNPAMIKVFWTGGGSYNYQYTTTGNYQVAVPPNTNLQIMANYSVYSGSVIASSSSTGSTASAPDILLCGGTSNQIGFSFDLTLNGQTTQYNFIPDSSQYLSFFYDNDFDGTLDEMQIYGTGIFMPGNYFGDVYLELDNLPGSPLNLSSGPGGHCMIAIDTMLIESYFDGTWAALTTNSLILQSIGIPDTSNTVGTFEFDFENFPFGYGTVTNGYFSVPRAQ